MALRAPFPQLADGRVYLDSAATTLKPEPVIAAMAAYYRTGVGPVHRSNAARGAAATQHFETARLEIAQILGVASSEIVFTGNCTAALCLVATALADRQARVWTSPADHHGALLAWRGRRDIRPLPLDARGVIAADRLKDCRIGAGDVVCVSVVSNVTGLAQPVAALGAAVRAVGARLVLDAAQAVGHGSFGPLRQVADFVAFSGHKLFGPEGVGVLWGRYDALAELVAVRAGGGGGAVRKLSYPDRATFRPPPHGLEDGTPNTGGVIGTAAALRFWAAHRTSAQSERLAQLADGLRYRLGRLPEVRILGGSEAQPGRAPIVSLSHRKIAGEQLAGLLSELHGIDTRGGHHCAEPLHQVLAAETGSLRLSLQLYNNDDDCDRAVEALEAVLGRG
ncbi:aminotransferase class V-fold PLP-dependent enzyme [Bradyrhizobium sp. UFLA05-153]